MPVVMNEARTLEASGRVVANPQEPEAGLLDAAKRRDPEAFNGLVTRYGPRIFRLAQNITGNREDAEEVSQDSFTRAFLHMDTFRGDSRFSTWLSRIAINQSLMKLRARRWAGLQFDRPDNSEDIPFCAEIADNAPSPEQRYLQEELQRILGSAIGELPMTF